MKKTISRAFLAIVMICELTFINVNLGLSQDGLIIVISSDTTWTKSGSPYSLTGPLLVSKGVTLTIEAGTTVNLNGYEILVKGTLRAIGNSANSINFTDGSITFDTESNGWNEQTGSGSIIEQSFLDSLSIFSDVPVKISNNKMMNVYIEGDSLLILDNEEVFLISVCGASSIRGNTLRAITIRGGSAIISDNTVQHVVISDGSPEISNNTIEQIFGSRGSPVISGNTIGKIGSVEFSGSTSEITYFRADSPKITNNTIRDGIYLDCETAIVSNNTIFGYSFEYSYMVSQGLFRPGIPVTVTVTTSGIIVGNGSASVSGNTIRDCDIGIKGGTTIGGNVIHNCSTGIEGGTTIEGNVLYNCDIGIKDGTTIGGNVIHNCSIGIEGGRTIEGNVLVNNHKGIVITEDKVTIHSNNITKGNTGISGHTKGEITIENNIISSQSSYGIQITSKATIIRNNTLTNNGYTTIRLDNCPSAKINYNNIENYGENSIYLINTAVNIDATNNWWGTTDTQAINLTIRDCKYDFDLGKVIFIPFLTEPNQEAKPLSEYELPQQQTQYEQEPETQTEPEPQQQDTEQLTLIVAVALVAIPIAAGLGLLIHLNRKTSS